MEAEGEQGRGKKNPALNRTVKSFQCAAEPEFSSGWLTLPEGETIVDLAG
jgi:hypothetical protein